jgi:hypothetical protein
VPLPEIDYIFTINRGVGCSQVVLQGSAIGVFQQYVVAIALSPTSIEAYDTFRLVQFMKRRIFGLIMLRILLSINL